MTKKKKAKHRILRYIHHPSLDAMRHVFESQQYDAFISSIVLFNLVLIVIETDSEGRNVQAPAWVHTTNLGILIAFVCEVSVKICVYQKSFAKDFWNMLDCMIVSVDVFSLALNTLGGGMPSLSMFRIARLVRLSRSVKFLSTFPELGLMLSALKGALKSLAWGMVLLLLALVIFGIMAVQLIHPINQRVASRGTYGDCERCPRAFESVWMAVLTTFQTDIAGDSWGTVAVPISEENPIAWVFFSVVIVLLQMLVMNVILAAVLDSATQAREENVEIIAKQRAQEMHSFQRKLVSLCELLDEDHSGSLTYEEVVEGFKKNESFFDIMEAMDIFAEDIASVWGILDKNHDGVVDYEEFAEGLFKLKSEDSHTMMVFLKYQVANMQDTVQAVMAKLDTQTDFLSILTGAEVAPAESTMAPLLSNDALADANGGNGFSALEDSMIGSSPTSPCINLNMSVLEQIKDMEVSKLKPVEAKLSMQSKAEDFSRFTALKSDISREITEKCRSVELKLDATRSIIESLVQEVKQRDSCSRVGDDNFQAVPTTPKTMRKIPAFCCSGSSGVVPPSSVLSIEIDKPPVPR